MTPVPIPDDCVPPGCKRVVFGPPDGDPTGDVRPVEAVVGIDEQTSELRIAVLVALEDGDLERLAECGAVWLTTCADHLHPFSVDIADHRDLDGG